MLKSIAVIKSITWVWYIQKGEIWVIPSIYFIQVVLPYDIWVLLSITLVYLQLLGDIRQSHDVEVSGLQVLSTELSQQLLLKTNECNRLESELTQNKQNGIYQLEFFYLWYRF